MKESEFWQRHVRPALKGTDAMRVENPLLPGTPDVECILGWVELKVAPKWPGGNAPLKLKHFTPQQRVWLKRRYQKNGRAWVLLHVQGDFLLLTGDAASRVLGKSGRDDLIAAASQHWTGGLPAAEEFQKCLCQN